MTYEELIESQLLLGKAASSAVVEILQSESKKAVVQGFRIFEDESTDAWKMTIEKVEE
ncbi:hypothetical protein [Weissella cibaria]|uniref:hypothetical protein n=1 Tax=Weissella cibaria TaxID=137591 RepID=UPI000A8C20E6|nr:hypothetical protein [Weissella cibaria]